MGDLKNQQSELIQILRAEHNKTSVQKWSIVNSFTVLNYWINLGYFLGNCPLTPPLSQDFALIRVKLCWLRGGVGGQFPRNQIIVLMILFI